MVAEVVASTVDYALSHFGLEEAPLEDPEYDFTRPHKKVRELFIKRLNELRTRFKAGEDITEDLHNLLARWLFSHIESDDMNYIPAVRARLAALKKEAREEGVVSSLIGRFFRPAG